MLLYVVTVETFKEGVLTVRRKANSTVCAGFFAGGEIEPGTFHGGEIEPGTFHCGGWEKIAQRLADEGKDESETEPTEQELSEQTTPEASSPQRPAQCGLIEQY